MDADDPQKSFIEEAISRVCRTMKKDFAPFLPKLLDMSLKARDFFPHCFVCFFFSFVFKIAPHKR